MHDRDKDDGSMAGSEAGQALGYGNVDARPPVDGAHPDAGSAAAPVPPAGLPRVPEAKP